MRASLVGSVLAVGLAASCAAGPPGEGELLRALGDDVGAIAVAAPRDVAGGWIERAALLVAPALPTCVLARARGATALALIWSRAGGGGGAWSLAMVGGTATAGGCDALASAGDLAWFGADPRAGAGRFFADPARKRRWRALAAAPVRALADVELQPGITMRATATLDPRDGVAARAHLRFADRVAADGATEWLRRWQARLDRARLGGAWPALAWELARDADDPTGASLVAELRLAGDAGERAMILLAAAVAGDALRPPTPPCPAIAPAWQDRVTCGDDGVITVARSLVDELAADPVQLLRAARVVPAVHQGAPAGIKLYAIRPASLVAALGLENGDRVHRVAGVAVTTPDAAPAAMAAARAGDRFEVELERRGRELVRRYAVR